MSRAGGVDVYGSVALSLCTTAHPRYAMFTEISGASISETTMRPGTVDVDKLFGGSFETFCAKDASKFEWTVRALSRRLSALSVSHSKSFLYGVFVWARRALNSSNLRFPARAVERRHALRHRQVIRCVSFVGIACVDSVDAELTIGLAPTLWGWPVWGEAWVFSGIPYTVFSYLMRF
jgi:hypothetical protein